ncbi:hypothetical protein [Lacipirellula sp.]|uniref:hypothetical protein n=1 Tax=Lacipirellula sp. TaxID=2691419 RepID=UPI003D11CAE6
MLTASLSHSHRITQEQFVALCRGIRVNMPDESQAIGWFVSTDGDYAGVLLVHPSDSFWGMLVVDLASVHCNVIQVDRALRSVASAERSIDQSLADYQDGNRAAVIGSTCEHAASLA